MVKSKIKELREKNKITQKILAEKLGVSRQALCMWESDKRELKAPILKKIAKIFRVPIDELINIKENFNVKKEKNIMIRKKVKKAKFEFMAPDARRVVVTGDFNSWDEKGIAMRKSRSKKGMWKTNVDCEPGKYEYKYIVDNEWMTDPLNQNTITNSFGTINSVVEIAG